MRASQTLGRLLVAGASAGVLSLATEAAAQAPPDAALSTTVGELLVTAERREEQVQQAPLAVTALTGDELRAARIDGGADLIRVTPNTNFTRSNFGGYNLEIRGIGSKVVGTSGEYAVSVHENATPITANRLADAEFFDVERVEVLRGPQGTLYGRNATGGAVNIITVRPGDTFGGWVSADLGSYDTRRFQGAINVPLTDILAVRWAGFSLKRSGYGANLLTGDDVDGRNIQSSRLSVRLHPDDRFELNVMWERFDEKDDRSRAGKELCITDPGPATLGGVPVSAINRGFLSQGCLAGSRYQTAAFGAVNTAATLAGLYLPAIGLASGNLLAGKIQDANLHDIEAWRNPIYEGRNDFIQIDGKVALSPHLTFESLTGFDYDRGYSITDYNRVTPDQTFQATGLAATFFPGGVVDDPQLGASDTLRTIDVYAARSREFTQEARLTSSFGGAWDFSLGLLHSEYRTGTTYEILSNGLTATAQFRDLLGGIPNVFPFYVDTAFPPSGLGRNNFISQAENRIASNAVFGEVYWRPAPEWQVTGGLRLTRDHKQTEPTPVTLFAMPTQAATPPASGQVPNPLFTGGIGQPAAPTLARDDQAATGRFNVAWTPTLGFTDRTMVYVSYSRGYKGGGFNTPCDPQSPGCAGVPPTFAPEHVNAYEIGTKNLLAGGAMSLDLTGFHYGYSGYQVSSTINKSAVNQNVDATVDGLELESVWEPVRNLRFHLEAGWLHTAITDGAVIDPLDRTQGNPALSVVKGPDASNCVVNRAGLERLLAAQEGLPNSDAARGVGGVAGNPLALLNACAGALPAFGLYDYAGLDVATAPIVVDNSPLPNSVVQVGQGTPVALKGKRLPNAPDWTLSFGAQYAWALDAWDLPGWRVTLHGDYYRQGDSYARIFNTETDHLKGYGYANASLIFARAPWGLEVQLYVKNLTNAQPITNLYLSDDSSGLFSNSFTLDPRQFGAVVTQRF